MNSFFRPRSSAFSLVEVVVAVGIFAIAIISIIGLLVPINRSVADVRDSDDASRLATVLQERLQSEVDRLKTANSATYWSTFAGYFGATPLYASRDGSKLALGNSTVWGTANATFNPDADKFFKVELIRNTTLSPDPTTDATSGFLAFTIKLTWPVYSFTPPGGTSVAASESSQGVLLLPAAVIR